MTLEISYKRFWIRYQERDRERERYGYQLIVKRLNAWVVSKKSDMPDCQLTIRETAIMQVETLSLEI